MSSRNRVWCIAALNVLIWSGIAHAAPGNTGPGLGKPATKELIAAWNISIAPDGVGLPRGRGSVKAGRVFFQSHCAMCHGATGEGGKGLAVALVGGVGSLATPHPVKTVGSYWSFATTLFDYIRRAMPLNAPMSLTNDQVYSVAAYILWRNGIIKNDNYVLDAKRLKAIKMPNRDGFITRSTLCQCDVRHLPSFQGGDTHGNGRGLR